MNSLKIYCLFIATLISTFVLSQAIDVESTSLDVGTFTSSTSISRINFANTHANLGSSPKRGFLESSNNNMVIGTSNNNTGGDIRFNLHGTDRVIINEDGILSLLAMNNSSSSAMAVGREPDGTLSLMSSSTPTYAVGDFVEGGVVFWVSLSGKHCKVVSIYDIGPVEWGNVYIEIGDAAQSDVNGAGNTVAILMQDGHTYSAAQHCADLAYGGYDDWYLPTVSELQDIYNNKGIINASALANGGEIFKDDEYWSSKEHDSTRANYFCFDCSSSFTLTFKSSKNMVRAVRAF